MLRQEKIIKKPKRKKKIRRVKRIKQQFKRKKNHRQLSKHFICSFFFWWRGKRSEITFLCAHEFSIAFEFMSTVFESETKKKANFYSWKVCRWAAKQKIHEVVSSSSDTVLASILCHSTIRSVSISRFDLVLFFAFQLNRRARWLDLLCTTFAIGTIYWWVR